MSEQTKIEWATHTFNPWEGCTKVSPGCTNCYAEARNHRFGMDNWGKGKPRRRTSAATWKNPVKWNRMIACYHCGTMQRGAMSENEGCANPECPSNLDETVAGLYRIRHRVFPSLCDWLDDEVPIEWLADFLKLIHDTPNLDWLLLTKRPENCANRLELALRCFWNTPQFQKEFDWLGSWIEAFNPPANVWIGASVEDQPRADERIPELLKIPAAVRFLSVEPLIGEVDLGRLDGIHWVICGGES